MRKLLAHGRATLDNFESFYLRHKVVLRAAAARHLHGRAELDDVIQEALIRIDQGFDSWSRDDRLRNALQAVRCAAIDTLRKELGTSERPEVIPYDFTVLEDGENPTPAGFGAELVRFSDSSPLVESGVLPYALYQLSEEELRVLLDIAHRGGTTAEVAHDMQMSESRVAYLWDEGRTHVRSLIRHGRGDGLAGLERLALIELESGRLTGRSRRRAQRHVDDCELCREIEVLERRTGPSDCWTGPDRRKPEGRRGRL